MAAVLGKRALNRALLARQHLLRRRRLPAAAVLEHLVGMQAQVPGDPYVGLWTRLDRFRPEELSGLIERRAAVRSPLLRATIHLVTAADCPALRPLLQPVLERTFAGTQYRRDLDGLDLDEVTGAGRALVEEEPRTRAELGRLLGERWPGRETGSLAQAVTYRLPLVQVPPRGLWGKRGQATWTTTEAWLGRTLEPALSPDELVLRYLRAFGPATVKDAQVWSGLTRLREVFDRLRPVLAEFRDDEGRELFDLPDAPRPDPDQPAPVRFLPEYDNLFLAHDDRSRLRAPDHRPLALAPGSNSTVLVDGFLRATWGIERERGRAVLVVRPSVPLSPADTEAVAAEGERLLAFLAAEADDHDVRLEAA